MNPIKRLGLIIAVALTMDAFVIASAFPQQNEAAALNEKVSELYRAGKFVEAVPLAQRALAIREKALGPDHLDVAQSLSSLAAIYVYQGRYADAEPLERRALAINEKALGPNHPNVATSLNNLAELYYDDHGHWADAEPLHKRALAIYEKALGPDHPYVALALNLSLIHI